MVEVKVFEKIKYNDQDKLAPFYKDFSLIINSEIEELGENEEYVLFKREKKKPLYVNSLGEEFFDGDYYVWFYDTLVGKVHKTLFNKINSDNYGEDMLSTEIAKSVESALKLALKHYETNK